MFLSKLTVNVYSRAFRRDHADIQDMHRTIMSAFPQVNDGQPARKAHGILWRLDEATRGFTLYVQSHTRPDWTNLPEDYLTQLPQTRDLQPVLDAVRPGRQLAFRLTANATRTIHPNGIPEKRGQGKRVPHRNPHDQIAWLIRQGQRHGFVIPLVGKGDPDAIPTPRPTLIGHKKEQHQQESRIHQPIRIQPVRFDGHLVITNQEAFTNAIQHGIGRSRAYGCGLITLAPPHSQRG